MRKALALILVLTAIFTVIPCSAYADKEETIDVSKLSDNQLLAYYFEIQEELLVRGLDASKQIKLQKGNYTVGYDIPASYYNLICVRTLNDDSVSYVDSMDTLFSAFGMGKVGDMFQGMNNAFDIIGTITVNILSSSGEKLKSFEMRRGSIEKITLEENQIIQVSDGCVALNPIE